jgi:mono/diheme cytochrome c family protein
MHVAPYAASAEPDGGKLFEQHCAVCHDATGAGVPTFAPPLTGPPAQRLKANGGRLYLTQVVVHGISGMFEADGQRHPGAMPSFAALRDDELAALLNHVLKTFNANALPPDFTPVAAAEIAAARAAVRSPRELGRTREALQRAVK